MKLTKYILPIVVIALGVNFSGCDVEESINPHNQYLGEWNFVQLKVAEVDSGGATGRTVTSPLHNEYLQFLATNKYNEPDNILIGTWMRSVNPFAPNVDTWEAAGGWGNSLILNRNSSNTVLENTTYDQDSLVLEFSDVAGGRVIPDTVQLIYCDSLGYDLGSKDANLANAGSGYDSGYDYGYIFGYAAGYSNNYVTVDYNLLVRFLRGYQVRYNQVYSASGDAQFLSGHTDGFNDGMTAGTADGTADDNGEPKLFKITYECIR